MTVGTWTRTAAATLFGSVVTAAVFLMMQGLIEPERLEIRESPPGAVLDFLPVIEPTPSTIRDPKPKRPDEPIEPPPTDIRPPVGDRFVDTFGVPFEAPPADQPADPTLGALSDGDALPIVKVQPVYPRYALTRNIEGYVLVEFTIDTLGRVVDVQVIEARPEGVFEQAALQAAQRFRYKPRVVNGQPTPVSGVRHLLTFEIESG
ncbi:MAG TPA: TonB family protein [Pseudomonadales bacterium]